MSPCVDHRVTLVGMAKTTGGGMDLPGRRGRHHRRGGRRAVRRLQPIGVWVFAVVLGGWVITLCLHEFAHAAVAYAGGDTSVRARGYLTLNPLRYTDLAYSVIIPILLLAVGGIPLPGGAVLVEPGRLRRRWYASLVSAAGPATNMVAGVVLARRRRAASTPRSARRCSTWRCCSSSPAS